MNKNLSLFYLNNKKKVCFFFSFFLLVLFFVHFIVSFVLIPFIYFFSKFRLTFIFVNYFNFVVAHKLLVCILTDRKLII